MSYFGRAYYTAPGNGKEGKKICHIRIIPTENFSPSFSLSLSQLRRKKVFFFPLLFFSRCPRDLLLRFEVHAVKRGERGKKFWWHHSLTHSTYVRRCVVMAPASFHFASRVPRRKKNEDDDENGKKTKQCLHVSFFSFYQRTLCAGASATSPAPGGTPPPRSPPSRASTTSARAGGPARAPPPAPTSPARGPGAQGAPPSGGGPRWRSSRTC